jgi:AcrR family transcriptional regulator
MAPHRSEEANVPGKAGSTGSESPIGRRTSRPRLSRHDVLSTALRLIDENGVDALTMRRLGHALGRDPMRLYRFAASKDELLDGVVELVLDELEVSSAPAEAWSDVLRATAHRYRRIALRHPHVVPLLVTRPLATPLGLRPLSTLRPLEALLELLVSAGFDPRGALHAYRLYTGFLQGHVLTELQERVYNPDETDALVRLGLYRLPPREFPRLLSLATALAEYDGAQELDEGLDIVLGGLIHELERQPASG